MGMFLFCVQPLTANSTARAGFTAQQAAMSLAEMAEKKFYKMSLLMSTDYRSQFNERMNTTRGHYCKTFLQP
jgi:hypothetical protein